MYPWQNPCLADGVKILPVVTSFLSSASQDEIFLCFDGVSISSIYIQWRNAIFALNKKSCVGANDSQ
ncbi:MAG: hypothetical protein SWX82_17570 [Cyanobacteriota bacterium]|nr:hypothetical protein [Cyanobacteriota bacterium]